nr:2-hydroxychromene-2-carboxylate isomerase [Pseudomonas sp.]
VFGSPTFVVSGSDEIFWGQDRLMFVERALARRAAGR